MTETGRTILQANQLRKTFVDHQGVETQAIQALDLYAAENEFISIVGPSGCGKSTFLEIAAGLTDASAGSLRLNIPVSGEKASPIGMVFQSYTLFPWLTVEENIRFGLKKTDLNATEKAERTRDLIRQVGLNGFESRYPAQLSGGMRQRVAIARSLVYRPGLLLMDEPFGALDSQTRLLMQELLLEVWQNNMTTVVFVTHDVEEAILLSDRIYVMTARPGTVKAELKVDFPRPRRMEAVETSPEFQELRQVIMGLLKEESRRMFNN